VRLLSFGCSTGEEVLSLRGYFPTAQLRGLDVDPLNISACRSRVRQDRTTDTSFEVAATTAAEPTASYDAIFCLAVLCLGDLTTSGAKRCDPQLTFDEFERVVVDFARCLKPSGLLLLHTTNFRLCDTRIAPVFDTLLEATEEQMAPDAQFGRDNRLLQGPRYRAVAFRKRG
jgi:SAM-dependent methyltransferase